MQLAGRLVGPDAALLAQDDPAGVDVLVDHEGGHAREFLAVDDGPVDGGGAAVLRQQRGVEVEGAQAGHAPDLLGQHAEGHDHEEVGLPGGEGLQEGGILELEGLQDRDAVGDGIMLDGALVHLEAPAAGLVGHRDHAHDLVTGLDEGVQGLHGEFGRAHINDAGGAEEAPDLAESLAPPDLELVHVE